MATDRGIQTVFYYLYSLYGNSNFFLNSVRFREGELYIYVEPFQLVPLLEFLYRNSCFQFHKLVDLYCVDYPERSARFELSYILCSNFHNCNIVVRVLVSSSGSLPSVKSLYKCAGWCEREVWDLFGVYFSGHSDLRRILTDYGFAGFPLRKDFPLVGFNEVRYDDLEKKVISEPVEFIQGYRYFDFNSLWREQ